MKKICPTCGKEFQPHGAQVYCSPMCYPERGKQRVCPVCGKVFEPDGSQVYCSTRCAQDEENRKAREEWQPKKDPHRGMWMLTCTDCGKQVWGCSKSKRCAECQKIADQRHNAEYAARQKAGRSRKLGELYPCENCGALYVLNGSLQRYCKNCAAAATYRNIRQHAADVYQTKTQDERREMREPRCGTFTRRQATCPICGDVFEASTTHRIYCSKKCAELAKEITQQTRRPRRQPPKPSKKVDRTCRICGKTFVGKKSECYCSPECRTAGARAYQSQWQKQNRSKNKPEE